MKAIHVRSLSRRSFLALAALLALTTTFELGCSSRSVRRDVPPGPRVSVMTLNVENLFDTKHDEGKSDYTFLPLYMKKPGSPFHAECQKEEQDFRRKECVENDYNDDVVKEKIKRISNTILQINDGRGPDIQLLVEVENKAALERLNNEGLSAAGYKSVILVEGPDQRGIDTAVLSRLPQWDTPKMHKIPYKAATPEDQKWADRSRGILEARLLLPDNTKLSVFAIHFPSQGNPTILRKQASEHLVKLLKGLPSDVLAIAGGDFNITSTEDKEHNYWRTIYQPAWLISHLVGCKGCQGTYYYHRKTEWSFFDALLFSASMAEGSAGQAPWRLDAGSIRIPIDGKYQLNRFDSPARFDMDSIVGVSDHWPMYAEIYKPQPAAVAPAK